MDILLLFVLTIWTAIAVSLMPDLALYAKELKLWQKLLICIIIIIGAPIMLINQALETILDNLLPGGWNDDEDKFGY